jgi:hypothetical protein
VIPHIHVPLRAPLFFTCAATIASLFGVAPAAATPLQPDAPTGRTVAPLAANAGWLETLNSYRAASGLSPVVNEPSWAPGIANHLRYLTETPPIYRVGPYANEHTENPASPYFTPSGEAASRASSLGYGWTERSAIETFFTAPFHAIGLLRPGLRRSAFAAREINVGVDTIRGLVDDRSTAPILFPGDASVTTLTTYTGNESPNPLETCTGFRAPSGLPLLALLPTAPSATIVATLSMSGASLDTCVVTADSFVTSDPIYGNAGRDTLRRDNAVVIVPRAPLKLGQYDVRLAQAGRADISWSFTVVAPPEVTDGRVDPGHPLRVRAGGPNQTITGTVTIVDPLHAGYATVYPCSLGLPATSNVNFDEQRTVAGAFVAEADPNGDLCVNVSTPADVVVDLVASADRPDATNPVRAVDTRQTTPVPAGVPVRLHVNAQTQRAVVGTVTITDVLDAGHLSIGACDSALGETSTVNVLAGETAANLFVAPVDRDGDLCVRSSIDANVVIDKIASTDEIRPTAQRLLDSRKSGLIDVDQIVRLSIPAAEPGETAVIGNLTIVDPANDGYVVVYDCGQPPPTTSNANYRAGQTVATAFVIGASARHELCVRASARTHILIDTSAATGVFGDIDPPVRAIDTRREPHRFIIR